MSEWSGCVCGVLIFDATIPDKNSRTVGRLFCKKENGFFHSVPEKQGGRPLPEFFGDDKGALHEKPSHFLSVVQFNANICLGVCRRELGCNRFKMTPELQNLSYKTFHCKTSTVLTQVFLSEYYHYFMIQWVKLI